MGERLRAHERLRERARLTSFAAVRSVPRRSTVFQAILSSRLVREMVPAGTRLGVLLEPCRTRCSTWTMPLKRPSPEVGWLSTTRRDHSRPADQGRARSARRGRPRPGHQPLDVPAAGGALTAATAASGGASDTRGQPGDVPRPGPPRSRRQRHFAAHGRAPSRARRPRRPRGARTRDPVPRDRPGQVLGTTLAPEGGES